MHNVGGKEWDQWNQNMRKILVDSQVKDADACANGSWDPTRDRWASRGGRVMMTSLAALTLEVHYRYLPAFKTDNDNKAAQEAKQ